MINPVLIAPFSTGLDKDIEPWIAPIDAFSDLNNIHVRHGYLQKREGYHPFGALTPMGATVNISDITQANPGEVTTAAPHGYSTGDKVYLDSIGGMVSLNNRIFTITVTAATTFTIGLDTTSLIAYTVGGTVALTDTSTDRVMGITRYIEPAGTKKTIAFNSRRAYRFDTTPNVFVQLDIADISSGGEYDYVWSTNWQSGEGLNRLYFTNGKIGSPLGAPTVDGIRYYDGVTDPTLTVPFNPTLGAGPPARTLVGGRLLFSLGQRLIVLDTDEYDTVSATTHPQRARWCAKQNPSNWNDVTAGGGGYTDAATGDQIVSARALQNQIIVFFTNSVWSLVATSDPNRAFKWQRINNFRACDGKMASIGYDRYVVAFGVRGITATDGVETKRIDQRISTFTTDEVKAREFPKVFGERSYKNNRSWALYSDLQTITTENNSALIYDEESSAFSTYSIDLNCMGYGNFSEDYALDDFTAANGLDFSLNEFGDETFFSYFWQDLDETLIGGDLYGNVFVLETDGDDNGVSIESTFTTSAWNPFKDEGVECQMNYIDIYLDTNVSTTATVDFYKDTVTGPYATKTIDFLPNLGFISSIIDATPANPVSINSPKHGLTTGDTVYIYGVQGMININSGETLTSYIVTVVNDNNITLDGIDGTSFPAFTTGGALYSKEFYRTKTWKRVYAGGIGFQHRIKFTSSGVDRPFTIHALKPCFKKRGRRNIN